MDDIPLDHGTLCTTLLVFRDLARYYVASSDSYAAKARAHLWDPSRVKNTFFASLHQDLDEICTYCCQADSWVNCDVRVRSEVHALLQCLESLIKPSKTDKVQV